MPTTSIRSAPRAHIEELDGLRGLAILLVFVFHSCYRPSSSFQHHGYPLIATLLLRMVDLGWSGVDLFFILSGYLITGILLSARTAANFLKVFYLRRMLRIFPIYYLSLALFFWGQPWLPDRFQFDHRHYSFEQLWYWFSISNLVTAFQPYLIAPLTHYWTLAIEEQFYLVWPWIVGRTRDSSLLLISIAGVVMATLLRNLGIVQAYNLSHTNFVYRLTPFRVDSLLFGAILAITLRTKSRSPRMKRWILGGFLTGLSLVAIAARGSSVDNPGTASMTRYGYTGFSIFYCSLLTACVLWSGTKAPTAVFRWKALRELGTYSYCIYIIHPAVLGILNLSWGHFLHFKPLISSIPYSSQVAIGLLGLPVCYGLARASWLLIESPALKLKDRFKYQYAREPQQV